MKKKLKWKQFWKENQHWFYILLSAIATIFLGYWVGTYEETERQAQVEKFGYYNSNIQVLEKTPTEQLAITLLAINMFIEITLIGYAIYKIFEDTKKGEHK